MSAMRGLNLSKFKKVSEDNDSATLIHKDGHTIRISKGSLPAIQRKQIENLELHEQNQYAEGGDVSSPTKTTTGTGGSSPGGASTGGVGSGIGGAGTGGAATGGASTGGAGTITVTVSGKGRVDKGAINISHVGGKTDAGNTTSGDGPGAAGTGGTGKGSEGGGGASPDEPKGFAEGGKVPGNSSLHMHMGRIIGHAARAAMHHYDEGGIIPDPYVATQQQMNTQEQDRIPYGTDQTASASPGPDPSQQTPTEAIPINMSGGAATPQEVAQPQAPAAPAPAASALPPNLGQIQNKGLGLEQQAEINLAKAVGEQGRQEAERQQSLSEEIKKLPTQNELFEKYNNQGKELMSQYASAKLDPSQYWTGDPKTGKNGHSKLLAGIGVALSALGQSIGLGHVQSNDALDTIHQGINDEVNRQKNSQERTMNLWKMNREALGNSLAADLSTKNQLAIGAQYDLQKIAAQNKGPVAMAQANLKSSQLQREIDANKFKLSLMSPTSDNPDPATRVQFLVPPERQAAVTKEIAEAQNTVHNAPGILEAFDLAAKDTRPLSGGLNTSISAFIPGHKSPGQQAFQGRIAPTVQEQEGTVRQSAFENIDKNMTPSFGDSDARIAVKRQTLLDYMHSKAAAANAKSFGIDLHKFPSTNTLGIGGAQQQPPTKIINGITYRRGPHNELIPV